MSSKNSSNQVEEKADDEVLKDQNVQREKVPESAQPSKPVKPPKPLGSKPSVVIGDTTVVPAFSMAKLMYYLRCVKTCVDLEISSRLIDYRNHQILTELEKRDVVTFAHRYRPDVLRNLIFFEVDERSSLLPSSANNFLSVDDPVVAEHFTLACNEITVDGVEYPIKKLLVFKYCWLHDFFSVPFAEENWRIGLSPKPLYLIGMESASKPESADIPLWCIGGLVCCIIFPPVGLVLLAIGACRVGQEAHAAQTETKAVNESTYVVV